MSRVDDDREAQRALERLALKQREAADRAKERVATESAFSRKMQEARASQDASARASVAARADEAESEALLAASEQKLEDEQGSEQSTRGGKTFDRRLRQGAENARDRKGDQDVSRGRQWTSGQESTHRTAAAAQSRGEDGRRGEEAFEERRGALRRGGEQAESAPGGEDLRTDQDGSQGGGESRDQGSDNPNSGFAGFRLNPALMAPVGVVKPKESSASERLRALANEIAQKIVERVRVGRNKDGLAEFQIDLKSSVLSGLSIRLSGSGGRIRAAFSGREREVLKLLREQSDGLKAALKARGLELEELKIEATA